MTSIDRRTVIALIFIVFGISIAIIAYVVNNNFFQSIFVNIASLLTGLGIGIFIINLHLENHKQKKIIYTAFLTIEYSFHNTRRKILKIIYTKYSVDEFFEVFIQYIKNEGRYAFLKVNDQKIIYEIVKDNYDLLKEFFQTLCKDVKEVVPILGYAEINTDFLEQILYFQRDTDYFLALDLARPELQEDAVVIFLNCVIGSHVIHRNFLRANNDDFPEDSFAWYLNELTFPKNNE